MNSMQQFVRIGISRFEELYLQRWFLVQPREVCRKAKGVGFDLLSLS
jgi:hypothetical protein